MRVCVCESKYLQHKMKKEEEGYYSVICGVRGKEGGIVHFTFFEPMHQVQVWDPVLIVRMLADSLLWIP